MALLAAAALLTLFLTPAASQETTGRTPASGPAADQAAAEDALRGPRLDTLGPFLLEPEILGSGSRPRGISAHGENQITSP